MFLRQNIKRIVVWSGQVLGPDFRQTGCNRRALHKLQHSLSPLSHWTIAAPERVRFSLQPSPLALYPFLPPSTLQEITDILLFHGAVMRWARLCVMGTPGEVGGHGRSLGGPSASPDSCCKMERSQWDQGGGVWRPQSLNTNVLLMPRCEGHQEHKLNEAFIVASVYNNHLPPSLLSDTHTRS